MVTIATVLVIIIPTLLCTPYLCSCLISCSSVPQSLQLHAPTLQTEVEVSGRSPSSNVSTPHSEDWEHHPLWWGVHRQHWHSQAGVPVQSPTRHMVTASHVYFGLTHLDGKLVTVGCRRHNQPTLINDVYMFQKSEKWKRSIPPMPAAYSHTTVVNYQSTIIVVSGGVMHWHTDSILRTSTNAVEVFQTKTFQWHHAEPLPVAHRDMSCHC